MSKIIYSKLQKVKMSLGPLVKGVTNDQYKFTYAGLPAIFRACNDALIEEGLLIDIEGILPDIKMTELVGKPFFLWSVAVVDCETGEKLVKAFSFPSDDPLGGRMKMIQATGSMMTYGQKYVYGAILSIQFEDDPDASVAKPIEVQKTWMTKAQFEIAKKATPKQIGNLLKKYDGKEFAMKKDYRVELETILNQN